MLSGRSAFAGQTVPDTIAGILEREPNWQALPPSTPRAIQLLLRRCVRKDPQERFRSIAIVRSEIAAAHTRLSKRASRVRQLAMAAVVVALTILSLVMWNERSQSLPESRPSLPESRPIPPVIEAPIVPQRRPPRIAPARIPRISHRFVGDNPPAKPPISTLSPNYPAQAQSAGIEGVVVLDLVIGTDGRVQDADVIMGQVPVLAQAALDAVRQWRFEPTLVDDVAVPVTIRVEVQFTLQ
jgi:TonB family protein